MSQAQVQQVEPWDSNIIAKTIEELNEISTRSTDTDRKLSHAFFKGTILFLKYEKQTLLSAVLDTCTRLRINDVEKTLEWSTNEGLIFQKVEGISLPIVTDKQTALYSFIGYKKEGASLFTLIQKYQASKKALSKRKQATAKAILAESPLIIAMKTMEKNVIATGKKFPQHTKFFAYMLEKINQYRE